MLKKLALVCASILLVGFIGGGGFFATRIMAFDDSMRRVYDVAVPQVSASTEPAAIARGKHLAESLGGCMVCHGAAGANGRTEAMGPVATMQAPNITSGKNGLLAIYSDGELARLIKHGIKRDGTAVRFMPAGDFSWWPIEDVTALISYLRTLPPVDTEPNVMDIKPLGKFLDRMDMMPLDHARRIDHANMPTAPKPEPTKAYGQHLGKLCQGCHGLQLSGGPMPGAPPELPTPLNLTPHQTGLKDWTYADFDKLMSQAVRRNGKALNPFMPIETIKNFNEVEKQALWAYLQSLPPIELGNR